MCQCPWVVERMLVVSPCKWLIGWLAGWLADVAVVDVLVAGRVRGPVVLVVRPVVVWNVASRRFAPGWAPGRIADNRDLCIGIPRAFGWFAVVCCYQSS